MSTMLNFDTNYTVYIKIDDQNRITNVNSSNFIDNTKNWIQIDKGLGDKYHHAQNHYFDKPIYTADGVPRYKLVDGRTVERSEDEIESDKPKPILQPPTIEELSKEITAIKEQIDSIFDVLTTLAHNI